METLFDIPATPLPPLDAARREFDEASAEYERLDASVEGLWQYTKEGNAAVRRFRQAEARLFQLEARESAFRKAAK